MKNIALDIMANLTPLPRYNTGGDMTPHTNKAKHKGGQLIKSAQEQ